MPAIKSENCCFLLPGGLWRKYELFKNRFQQKYFSIIDKRDKRKYRFSPFRVNPRFLRYRKNDCLYFVPIASQTSQFSSVCPLCPTILLAYFLSSILSWRKHFLIRCGRLNKLRRYYFHSWLNQDSNFFLKLI
jgi:hypothetical protein